MVGYRDLPRPRCLHQRGDPGRDSPLWPEWCRGAQEVCTAGQGRAARRVLTQTLHEHLDPGGCDALRLEWARVLEQLCTAGQWADTETCQDPDVCVNEVTQARAPLWSQRSGRLGPALHGGAGHTETCQDPDVCVNEVTRREHPCGLNGQGALDQLCTACGRHRDLPRPRCVHKRDESAREHSLWSQRSGRLGPALHGGAVG